MGLLLLIDIQFDAKSANGNNQKQSAAIQTNKPTNQTKPMYVLCCVVLCCVAVG
jgi:hypothetical protein